jgi:methylmalonyl-CoA mutase cobalamin-binding subunit
MVPVLMPQEPSAAASSDEAVKAAAEKRSAFIAASLYQRVHLRLGDRARAILVEHHADNLVKRAMIQRSPLGRIVRRG